MSLRTRIRVDGQWTTRSLDIHEVLARNKDNNMQQVPQALTVPKPPVQGILTQTLVHSPVVQQIIPARIRHQSKNDVVFVYSNSIEIKEVVLGPKVMGKTGWDGTLENIHLETIVTKRDFESNIRSARILGQQRQAIPVGSQLLSRDLSIKTEDQEVPKPEPLHDHRIPPHILVLTLECRKIAFLFAYHDLHGSVHFLSQSWPLPPQASYLEELGEYLAVDPK
ncbi:MAG: hypothetical protein Q9167_000156 [Letrouitia subvulpina]